MADKARPKVEEQHRYYAYFEAGVQLNTTIEAARCAGQTLTRITLLQFCMVERCILPVAKGSARAPVVGEARALPDWPSRVRLRQRLRPDVTLGKEGAGGDVIFTVRATSARFAVAALSAPTPRQRVRKPHCCKPVYHFPSDFCAVGSYIGS